MAQFDLYLLGVAVAVADANSVSVAARSFRTFSTTRWTNGKTERQRTEAQNRAQRVGAGQFDSQFGNPKVSLRKFGGKLKKLDHH